MLSPGFVPVVRPLLWALDGKRIGAKIRTMNAKYNEINAFEYKSDALSPILNLLKLDADIYYNGKVCGDWQINEHSLGATCFHMVTVGSCRLDVPGHFSGELHCGDLAIFPRELAHSMLPTQPADETAQYLEFAEGRDIDGTGMLCGEMRFHHRGSNYILDALPALFIIRHDSSSEWLHALRSMIIDESLRGGPASKVLLNKLSELLFTYALREFLLENPGEVGMLALYGHPRLARAISAFHRTPEREWGLEALAREAAMSRTTFAETFRSISGWTAGQYMTWWRMQLAWSLLSDGEGIARVAGVVGYKSESAFSRTFSKTFSLPPGRVRKGAADEKSIASM